MGGGTSSSLKQGEEGQNREFWEGVKLRKGIIILEMYIKHIFKKLPLAMWHSYNRINRLVKLQAS